MSTRPNWMVPSNKDTSVFMLQIQNDGCMEKVWCKYFFVLSLEATPKEVFCANNTTRDSVVSWS